MRTKSALLALILTTGTLSGCVQMPTEKQYVVDSRPQISFRADGPILAAKVYIDGLAAGLVGDYLEGRAALRVLPGTHQIRVVGVSGDPVLDEKVYLGDGVSRTLLVK